MADPTPDTTLLDRMAGALAQERFAASLAEIRPHCCELAYRSADAVLSVVQPELDRLVADNRTLSEELGDLRAELARRAGVAPDSDFGKILRSLDLMYGGPGFTHEKRRSTGWTPAMGDMVTGRDTDTRTEIVGEFRHAAGLEAAIRTTTGIRYVLRHSLRPAPQTEQERPAE